MTGHSVLPQPEDPITIPLVEALHFRTGFHYIMVREMEMQIPIPSLPGNTNTCHRFNRSIASIIQPRSL